MIGTAKYKGSTMNMFVRYYKTSSDYSGLQTIEVTVMTDKNEQLKWLFNKYDKEIEFEFCISMPDMCRGLIMHNAYISSVKIINPVPPNYLIEYKIVSHDYKMISDSDYEKIFGEKIKIVFS